MKCVPSYMPKLTLSVDEKVVWGAKRYAAARSTSVSRLVERYLDLLSKPPQSMTTSCDGRSRSPVPDFEDAVCAAAAEAGACDAIVTRDPDGYPNASLPVIDPAAALTWLTQD